jgi:two-component sensor histidine kinase
VKLTRAGKRGTLTIEDNGVGIADGFDAKESKGFGLTLVRMLSQQLQGTFTIEKHKGTRCKLEFDI